MIETIEEKYRTYLTTILNTGKVNMMATAPYLVRDFGISKSQADEIVIAWMSE